MLRVWRFLDERGGETEGENALPEARRDQPVRSISAGVCGSGGRAASMQPARIQEEGEEGPHTDAKTAISPFVSLSSGYVFACLMGSCSF